MHKMAIFVEGQTEQCFIVELIRAIADSRHIQIDTVKAFGGGKQARQFVTVQATGPDPAKKYYVLVLDCSNDDRVLSDIRDQYSSLINAGYSAIIGIRDVYPSSPTDIPTIRSDFTTFAPQTPIQPQLILAIMEIEAWFLAEHTHFFRLDGRLTLAAVNAALGYDLSVHDMQQISHPSADLRIAYGLVGLGYNKSRKHVQRTVGVLDYARYYLELPARIPDLQALINGIDKFLS
jgi:hypothetical protein